ncbi:MAG: TetR/AcrR family transcriptional regulator [Thermoanaerobaculales bacterium]|jgi:AcrR family transcriptional regulator|nr:TetR/AcrR family transcriptional regulator [Thermoanaerobaculales bacterium]
MTKRTAILHAATHAFAAKGLRETSTTELATMTDVAEGTVFYHFGSKENLFLAVLDHVRHELEGAFKGYLESQRPASGLAMLEEAVAFYLHLAEDRVELFLLLHRSDAYELARANEQCRAELEKIFNCLVGVFEAALTKGQEDGSIRPSVAPRRMALLIFNMVDGLVRLRDCALYEPGVMFPEILEACRGLVARRTNRTE